MNLREAAEQALEALGSARSVFNGEHDTCGGCGWCHAPSYGPCEPHCEKDRAVKALRAALADTQDWDEVEALRASLREHMSEIHRLRAAGRQALEALDVWRDCLTDPRAKPGWRFSVVGQSAIAALRAALAEDAMQRLTDVQQEMEATISKMETVEPVAYVTGYSKGYAVVEPVDRSLLMPVGMALYRSPPKREPLADEEIVSCIDEDFEYGLDRGNISNKSVIRFARAIERAHDIGGEE